MGSASELEYHLLLARDLKLIKPKDHTELSQCSTELKRMLAALFQLKRTGALCRCARLRELKADR
ncbi:MAG: four helix bundle protein [Acidobacteriaceae bacterium]|nr:four helix bundle protein [Acidobacteriaceae bacterium]